MNSGAGGPFTSGRKYPIISKRAPLRATLRIHGLSVSHSPSLCDLSATAILPGPFKRSGSRFCLRGGPKQCISGPIPPTGGGKEGGDPPLSEGRGCGRESRGWPNICLCPEPGGTGARRASVAPFSSPWGSLFPISCYQSGSMFSCAELSGA